MRKSAGPGHCWYMRGRDDDFFSVRPGPPRSKRSRGIRLTKVPQLVSRVVRAANRAGRANRPGSKSRSSRPGAKRGRGYVAARTDWSADRPRSRRVIVKTRIVTREESSPTSIRDHLNYLQREGASRDGERGRLYSATEDSVDRDAFEKRFKTTDIISASSSPRRTAIPLQTFRASHAA